MFSFVFGLQQSKYSIMEQQELKELTKAEEQVMQILWELEHAFVKEIVAQFPEPKPAYNTVSTIVRILVSKGFVSYNSYGKSHRYFAVIDKETYKKMIAKKLLHSYFENSPKSMLSFFLQEEQLDIEELDDILTMIERQKSQNP